MKTRFTPLLLLLAVFTALAPRLRAGDVPKFQYPLVQLIDLSFAITETDLAVYTRAFNDEKPVFLPENALYLKGDDRMPLTANDQDVKALLLKVSASPTFNPLGAKVYQFHIKYNKSTALADNAIMIVSGDLVDGFRAHLKEGIPLVEKKKTTQLWKWVVAGLTSENKLVKSDAIMTEYYTTDDDHYIFDHYENRPIDYINRGKGLDIKDFPANSKEALAVVVQQVCDRYISTVYHPIISLGYELQVPGFTEICLKSAVQNIQNAERMEQLRRQPENQAYTSSPNIEAALTLSRMALTHPASSLEQQQRAARLLIFTQRLQAHYKILNQFPTLSHPEHTHYLPALAAFLGSQNPAKEVESLIYLMQVGYRSNLRYPQQNNNWELEGKISYAATEFNKLAASRIDMCVDPVIDQLTGNRNWWGCHKVEGPETFVLANTQGSSTTQVVNISVAPNPIREGRCTVEWNAESEAASVTLLLIDGAGRQVWTQKHELTRYTSLQQAVIELPASIAAGVYSLTVQYPDRQLEVKVMVE